MPPEFLEGQIAVHLDRLLEEREMTLTALAAEMGITQANLSILKNGHAKAIRFSTLAALCQALACQPGDILAYVDEPSGSSVILVDPGDRPIAVVKVLRQELRLSLRQAKALVDDAPSKVGEHGPRHEAEVLMVRLRAQGATVEVRDS